jgi:hypothetical protein
MLKALVILVAIVIAVVNVAAQSNGTHRRVVRMGGVFRVGPSTTYLKQGLSTTDVVKLLGQPTAVTDRDTNGAVTYEFPRGEGRVLLAEFINNSLVSSRMETRGHIQPGLVS